MTMIALAILTVGAVVLIARGMRSSQTSALPSPGSRFVTVDGRRVLVHVPKGLKRLRTVLYFHGFGGDIANLNRDLMPFLDRANDPAIIVMPQLGAKSEVGSLSSQGAIAKLLRAALQSPGQIDVLAHSGGYRAASTAIAVGGAPISSVGLLDALYGDLTTFQQFAGRSTTQHFANVYGPSTRENSLALAKTTDATLRAISASKPDDLVLRSKVSAQATSVAHVDVPSVYGAAMIDAFSS